MHRIILGLLVCLLLASPGISAEPLGPGDHNRAIVVKRLTRTYQVHVPAKLDRPRPSPVVLALHGAAMNSLLMPPFCGLNETADESGFIVVYPNGTGSGPFLTWNAGGFPGGLTRSQPDDVAFIARLLDDLATVVKVDTNRVFACGMSNGGMMCYRLAAELSDRIAAIAPVAGTIAIESSQPKRPVPVLHFHGTADAFVPFKQQAGSLPPFMKFMDAGQSVQTWVKLNGCNAIPRNEVVSKADDALKVTRTTYGGGKDGAEVVLVTIEGGGHTWPGVPPLVGFIGRSATNLPANQIMWDFFQKHPRK